MQALYSTGGGTGLLLGTVRFMSTVLDHFGLDILKQCKYTLFMAVYAYRLCGICIYDCIRL